MGKGKFGRILMIPLVLVMAVTLVATAACTPEEIQTLNGLLENVDSANGKITIVTKDGKTVTVKIDTDTEVAAQGTTTNASSLERGVEVEVKVRKDGQVARQIAAKQAQVEGTISKIESGNVTIQQEKGSPVTVLVTTTTRIAIGEEHAGTLADLKMGLRVHAKYDPTTKQAFKIEVQEKEENKGEDEETSRVGWGIVEIRVTDPPPAGVKSAVVNFSKIEIHKANGSDNTSTSDNESGWITVVSTPGSFDLMSIIGIDQILGSANLTAGKYTQIRMSVTNVTGITTDNVSYTAEVPSDKLKIVGSFNVGGGKKTVLTLDFDGAKSLIRTGEGKFLFKPVVKLLVNEKTGEGQRGETDKTGKTNETERKGNSANNSGKKD